MITSRKSCDDPLCLSLYSLITFRNSFGFRNCPFNINTFLTNLSTKCMVSSYKFIEFTIQFITGKINQQSTINPYNI